MFIVFEIHIILMVDQHIKRASKVNIEIIIRPITNKVVCPFFRQPRMGLATIIPGYSIIMKAITFIWGRPYLNSTVTHLTTYDKGNAMRPTMTCCKNNTVTRSR